MFSSSLASGSINEKSRKFIFSCSYVGEATPLFTPARAVADIDPRQRHSVQHLAASLEAFSLGAAAASEQTGFLRSTAVGTGPVSLGALLGPVGLGALLASSPSSLMKAPLAPRNP
jgi:hypothetical protein